MNSGYGIWPLVIINTAIFAVFAASFFHPRSRRDWHAMGAYTGFLVALFTEMYGFPVTIYLLAGPLGSRFPLLRADHAGGHLWNDLIGWTGDPHMSPFHLASYALIGGGFWLIAVAWRQLFAAARSQRLATTGPYAWLRHPQYAGFLLVMIGLLLQWPTIPTLIMFPILLIVYRRLALNEEREVAAAFGPAWAEYAAAVHPFLPRSLPYPGAPGPASRESRADSSNRRDG